MGSYMDYDEPRGRRNGSRVPYPTFDNDNYSTMEPPPDYPDPRGRPPPPRADDLHAASSHLPPPPLGENDNLKPALKREGSRSRLSPDARAQFEDGVSALGKGPPDLERKNRPRDKAFRDLRDGYESDEGEAHRGSKFTPKMPRGGDPRDDDGYRGEPRRRPRDRDYPPPESALSSRGGGRYDDPPPPRRNRRDPDPYYEDDYPPPRRRGDRPPTGVEYGAAPVPARHRSDRRPPPRRGDYDDYSDDDDYRPRRRRSVDGHGRRPRDYDDGPYYSDDQPRRRRDDYDGPRRRDRSRRRDSYDDYDRYDDRRDRDRDRRGGPRLPKEIKVGKYDIGPYVEKGQKHWGTIAPILTPLVLNYARKYLSSKGGR